MAGEVLLNQNEESMALLVSAHGQPSVSNMILKYYLKSLFGFLLFLVAVYTVKFYCNRGWQNKAD